MGWCTSAGRQTRSASGKTTWMRGLEARIGRANRPPRSDRRRHGLDAGAEDFDVEGAPEAAERENGPSERADERLVISPHVDLRGEGSEAEIEEEELDEGGRIAEELDVAGDEGAQDPGFRALGPCADNADDDRERRAGHHQLERGDDPLDEARELEGIVEEDEIDAGRLVEVTGGARYVVETRVPFMIGSAVCSGQESGGCLRSALIWPASPR